LPLFFFHIKILTSHIQSMIILTAFVQLGARVFAKSGTFRNIHPATSCHLYAIVCQLLMSSVVARLILLNLISLTNVILLDFVHCTLFFTHVVLHLLVRTLRSVLQNITTLYTNFLICLISHLNQSSNAEVYRAASFVLDLLFLRQTCNV
jgi:hypothetical protein